MIFRQFMLEDLQSAAYLVGDRDAGTAAIVDPHLNVEEYLDAAQMYGVTIDHVLETHTHADRVSGHGRLAELGAQIHIHRIADAEYPHDPIDDGWSLKLGSVELRAMHTPGHRPEHTAFVVIDHARSDEPWAVLTGDSLFVSDIGRPDLAIEATEGARDLFRSLHDGLLKLPPTTEVWPGHTGGSLCGGPGMDLKTSSTIGFERDHNSLLRETDEGRFVSAMISDLPPPPANLQRIVDLNRGPLIESPPEPEPLSADQFDALMQSGALVVDVRDSASFDASHIPGSLWIPFGRGGFANRLALLARPGERVILVGRSDRDAAHAAALAPSVGVADVPGYLNGGFDSWMHAEKPTTTIEWLSADRLAERLEAVPEMQFIDVRDTHEINHDAARIPNVPLGDLRDAELDLDSGRPLAVICASGLRAGIGASVIGARGFTDLIHVADGGIEELAEARRSVTS